MNLVYGALTEAEILTSHSLMYLVNSGPVLGTGTLPTGVSTSPKWSKNVPMCLREPAKKKLVHISTMRSENNSISEVPTPDPLGVYVLAPDPLGVNRYLCTACFKILHIHRSYLENSMSAPGRGPT